MECRFQAGQSLLLLLVTEWTVTFFSQKRVPIFSKVC